MEPTEEPENGSAEQSAQSLPTEQSTAAAIAADTLIADAATESAEAEARKLTRRGVVNMALGVGGFVGGLYLFNQKAPMADGLKSLFRHGLEFNENVARSLFFNESHRAQTFDKSQVTDLRSNGVGDSPEVDAADWRLTLEGAQGGTRKLTLADIKKMPSVEQTTEFKCIEGWSAIMNWTGVPFADFVRAYPPSEKVAYVSMISEPDDNPDNHYYVGLDFASAVHPQTILAYQKQGKPLTADHGAPLRLVIPHKYGVKNIKLITKIVYTNQRPADYWEERGYDWYAGL